MKFRPEVIPFILAAVVAAIVIVLIVRVAGASWKAAAATAVAFNLIAVAYFLYFFRDPERLTPNQPGAIVSAAEGRVSSIVELTSEDFRAHARRSGLDPDTLGRLATRPATRISVFLSPMNVHVNRSPIAGQSRFLGYFPGRHILTLNEKSSEENQHNSILIENARTSCLLNQIVGPICRRVVYWPDHDRAVPLKQGERLGMMKFGSRLDLYFPRADIRVVVKPGDLVRAGETVIAHLEDPTPP